MRKSLRDAARVRVPRNVKVARLLLLEQEAFAQNQPHSHTLTPIGREGM
jgi:hypothetical protein